MRNSSKALIGTGAVATAVVVFAAFRLRMRHPVGNRSVPEPAKPLVFDKH